MKRPYTSASYEKSSAGFALLLDGRPARTPAGNPLQISHAPLAEAIVAEWEGQGEKLRKDTMPLTQLACVAIDLAGRRRDELMADMLGYVDTDLVCYRTEEIPALAERQAQLLDPVLQWAQERFAVTCNLTGGLMPVAQPEGNEAKLACVLSAYDDWRFAALVAAAPLLGSLMLALAFTEGHIDAASAFRLSHLEESYETEKWGRDEEKEAGMLKLAGELAGIGKYLSLL